MMLIRWRTLPRIRFLGPSPPDASFTSHSPPPSSLLWARRRKQDVWGNEKDIVASVSKGSQVIISEETHLLRAAGFLLDLRVEGGRSLRAITYQVEANLQGRCRAHTSKQSDTQQQVKGTSQGSSSTVTAPRGRVKSGTRITSTASMEARPSSAQSQPHPVLPSRARGPGPPEGRRERGRHQRPAGSPGSGQAAAEARGPHAPGGTQCGQSSVDSGLPSAGQSSHLASQKYVSSSGSGTGSAAVDVPRCTCARTHRQAWTRRHSRACTHTWSFGPPPRSARACTCGTWGASRTCIPAPAAPARRPGLSSGHR